MVGEQDRLAALQVGVAGDDRIRVSLGTAQQRRLEPAQELGELVEGIPAIHAHVECDLVVARACGVQLGTGVADAPRQLRLDVHVDVLEGDIELEIPGGDVFLDPLEPASDLVELALFDDPGAQQGSSVRDRAAHIVRVEPPVIGDRLAVILDEVGGAFFESAFPHGE